MARNGTQAEEKESTSTTLPVLGQNCNIHLVYPDEVPHIWDQVEPLLSKATPYSEGEVEAQDFAYLIINNEMQLWVSTEDKNITAAMVTQVVHYPRKKVLRIIALGGKDLRKMQKKFEPILEGYAIKAGCSALEAWTRRGLLRLVKDWKQSYIIITKDIKEKMH